MDWVQNLQKDFTAVGDALTQLSLDRLQEDPDLPLHAGGAPRRPTQADAAASAFQQRLLAEEQGNEPQTLGGSLADEERPAERPRGSPTVTQGRKELPAGAGSEDKAPAVPATPPKGAKETPGTAAPRQAKSEPRQRVLPKPAAKPKATARPVAKAVNRKKPSYKEPVIRFEEIGMRPAAQAKEAPEDLEAGGIGLGQGYKRTPRRPDEEWRVRAEADIRAEEEERARLEAEAAAKAREEERLRAEQERARLRALAAEEEEVERQRQRVQGPEEIAMEEEGDASRRRAPAGGVRHRTASRSPPPNRLASEASRYRDVGADGNDSVALDPEMGPRDDGRLELGDAKAPLLASANEPSRSDGAGRKNLSGFARSPAPGARAQHAAGPAASPPVLTERESGLLARMRGFGDAASAELSLTSSSSGAGLVGAVRWLAGGFLAEENRNFVGICFMTIMLLLSYYKMRRME